MTDNNTEQRDQSADLQNRELQTISSDDIPTIYVNNVGIRSSLFDFRLELGEIVEANPDKLVIRNLAIMMVSPQHAKVMAQVLTEHVRQYEEKFGPLPKDLNLKATAT